MKWYSVVTHFLVRTWLHPSDRRWPSAATAWSTSPSVRCAPRGSPDCDCRSQWPFTVTSFVAFTIQKFDVRWLTKKVVWNFCEWLFTVTVDFWIYSRMFHIGKHFFLLFLLVFTFCFYLFQKYFKIKFMTWFVVSLRIIRWIAPAPRKWRCVWKHICCWFSDFSPGNFLNWINLFCALVFLGFVVFSGVFVSPSLFHNTINIKWNVSFSLSIIFWFHQRAAFKLLCWVLSTSNPFPQVKALSVHVWATGCKLRPRSQLFPPTHTTTNTTRPTHTHTPTWMIFPGMRTDFSRNAGRSASFFFRSQQPFWPPETPLPP